MRSHAFFHNNGGWRVDLLSANNLKGARYVYCSCLSVHAWNECIEAHYRTPGHTTQQCCINVRLKMMSTLAVIVLILGVDLYMLVVISATKTGGQRRQFPPGPWVRTRPVLRRGRVHTLVDPTKFWQGDEISNRYFCHVSWHFGHCIPFQPIKRLADLIVFRALPTVDSPCTLFTFTYLQRQTARRTTAILLY